VAVVSLNMAKESNVDLAFRDISGRLADADILLLQEVSSNERTNVAAELAHKLDRHVAFAPAAPGVTDQGLAIVSRYPLRDVKTFKLKPCDLRFRSRFRIGLAATAETPSGPMRIIDIHLDTRINTADRLAQLRPAIEDADAFDGPKLIGGDFNTNDMYWVGNIAPIPRIGRHSLAVLREFARHGYTTPFGNSGPTFPSMRLHLDWIYVKGIEARAAGISRVPFSDHHAIWTRLG
jgi:endonuclease/exonuclease/phosphatase family metal-dependent hydrolase